MTSLRSLAQIFPSFLAFYKFAFSLSPPLSVFLCVCVNPPNIIPIHIPLPLPVLKFQPLRGFLYWTVLGGAIARGVGLGRDLVLSCPVLSCLVLSCLRYATRLLGEADGDC